jgi:hypothetical protein
LCDACKQDLRNLTEPEELDEKAGMAGQMLLSVRGQIVRPHRMHYPFSEKIVSPKKARKKNPEDDLGQDAKAPRKFLLVLEEKQISPREADFSFFWKILKFRWKIKSFSLKKTLAPTEYF